MSEHAGVLDPQTDPGPNQDMKQYIETDCDFGDFG